MCRWKSRWKINRWFATCSSFSVQQSTPCFDPLASFPAGQKLVVLWNSLIRAHLHLAAEHVWRTAIALFLATPRSLWLSPSSARSRGTHDRASTTSGEAIRSFSDSKKENKGVRPLHGAIGFQDFQDGGRHKNTWDQRQLLWNQWHLLWKKVLATGSLNTT